MHRTLVAALLSLSLGSCVATSDQSATAKRPGSTTVEVLDKQVESARRVVELLELRLESQRALAAAGRDHAIDLIDAEIAVEEARIRLRSFELESHEAQARRD